MKILIIQEASRHKESYDFRESLCMNRALTSIGASSLVWGLGHETFEQSFEEISKSFDIVLLLENYEVDHWVPELCRFKGLKLFWSIDSHCVLEKHIQTCDRHDIDIVLNSIESDQRHFMNRKTYYFPNACATDIIYPISGIKKTYPIGFCGNYLNRKDWIRYLDKKIGIKKDIMVLGNDMVKAINSYRIHFNRNIANDINFRTFETLGCQTVLFTNFTENLDKLFTIGEHLIVYKTKRDLVKKYKYLINRPDKLDKLAEAGYQHLKKYHTYRNRAELLLEIIDDYRG